MEQIITPYSSFYNNSYVCYGTVYCYCGLRLVLLLPFALLMILDSTAFENGGDSSSRFDDVAHQSFRRLLLRNIEKRARRRNETNSQIYKTAVGRDAFLRRRSFS